MVHGVVGHVGDLVVVVNHAPRAVAEDVGVRGRERLGADAGRPEGPHLLNVKTRSGEVVRSVGGERAAEGVTDDDDGELLVLQDECALRHETDDLLLVHLVQLEKAGVHAVFPLGSHDTDALLPNL